MILEGTWTSRFDKKAPVSPPVVIVSKEDGGRDLFRSLSELRQEFCRPELGL